MEPLGDASKDPCCIINGDITDHEFNSMLPSEAKVGKLYGLAKDHKEYDKIPDFRPIASLCGSMTEQLGRFIDFHIRPVIEEIQSHLDDTPHFLRELESLKTKVGEFPVDVMPISIDVSKLYPSIPIEEGISAVEEALDRRTEKGIRTDVISMLLRLVLSCNVVEFNNELYHQK